ncbi:MAG: hypothetical protein ACREVH_04200 [Gammaproteobacteria bacterium]
MNDQSEPSQLFEIWWTAEIDGAYRRWIVQQPRGSALSDFDSRRSFAREAGLLPAWAR